MSMLHVFQASSTVNKCSRQLIIILKNMKYFRICVALRLIWGNCWATSVIGRKVLSRIKKTALHVKTFPCSLH